VIRGVTEALNLSEGDGHDIVSYHPDTGITEHIIIA